MTATVTAGHRGERRCSEVTATDIWPRTRRSGPEVLPGRISLARSSCRCKSWLVNRLTAQQAADVAIHALANARRMHDDAVFLRHAGRLPSAFMVAGLAADELGKHVIVTSFFGRNDTDAEWRKFWRRFRQHEAKLGEVASPI